VPDEVPVTVTFAGSGDAFGSGGRFQACIHLAWPGRAAALLDCGATSLTALKSLGLDPGSIAAVFVSHLHGDHFGGLPFLILDGQFSRRSAPLVIVGPAGLAERLADAMECLFPGSSTAARRFGVETVELAPGRSAEVAGITAHAWPADHRSGADALLLRLEADGTSIAYTGDTAWTDDIIAAASGADLLIAEAYYRDKDLPYHLRYADLDAHREQLTARRIILTHMSADMLGHQDNLHWQAARDGLVISV
jgi:ribonuclease BN (tRNA processing enzyme)